MAQMLRNESSRNVVIDKIAMMNNCAQGIPGFHIYLSKKNEELLTNFSQFILQWDRFSVSGPTSG